MNRPDASFDENELRYLKLLSKSFPTITEACTEIMNLQAILNLPKGTEHFLTDIHGEYEAFRHVLKNASGSIERKINDEFGDTLRESVKRDLCTLICYPEERLAIVKSREDNIDEWYLVTLIQLVKMCQRVSVKYTRSKVRKALPPKYSYIIEELMHESLSDPNKQAYLNNILSNIIELDRADDFIITLCDVIQRLVIDSLHIVGDIYDRGPGAHIVMETLMNYHDVDIQWGNHDILWMGAAVGNISCMANVIRICLRYGNLRILEDGYGINLVPLATFAMEAYGDDPCDAFQPRLKFADDKHSDKSTHLISQMMKAISIIQFKLEADIIKRRPEFEMADRNLLHLVNYEKGTVMVYGKEYPMLDTNFPTVDPADPYRLTPEEEELVGKLHRSFVHCERLRRHIEFLLSDGSLYLVRNGNLMFHASMPLNADGSFKSVIIDGVAYAGKALMDKVDSLIRKAYFGEQGTPEHSFAVDYMWYIWCGPDSVAFDKGKMTTFERCFIADKEPHKEPKGHYYILREQESVCDMILDEFGVKGVNRHIINGHVPVKTIKGESPIRAGGKMLIIDGGFSRAYQGETGIAGYTLIFNSRGMQLVQHEPFTSTRQAIEHGVEIKGTRLFVDFNKERMLVNDTDNGEEIRGQIAALLRLVEAYRNGLVKER
ncbi:MAG TPA: fructose-1,6-bisphosphatase [Bacteroidales bacterium]|jgi:fructose-1,6-bisphosphatase-3|nr:fructose-1,6-bisphosphatase [Bacteroidales bacterium]HPB88859.1 fructose-1,6-bisphosphatase [Bacteroidales bacterium]HQN23549.1 fructose-1,6-bisphosphatase [Bacteroidales bacterium]HQP78996.1 fructose-1,6-bisphosphatase [Bacteroidales bacterium]